MADPAIEAAVIGFVLASFGGGIGWFLRDLREKVNDMEDDVEENAEFRRVMTGEEVASNGELPEIEESFSEVSAEIENLRHEQAKEHRKVWEALSSIHTSIGRLVDAVNSHEGIDADVERPEHPFEYRRDGGEPRNDD